MQRNTRDDVDLDVLCSERRAEAITGVPRAHIGRGVRRREIPGYRLGLRTILVRPSDVLAWLENYRLRPSGSVAKRVAKEARAR
jgi:excisionase family DNA binding protein